MKSRVVVSRVDRVAQGKKKHEKARQQQRGRKKKIDKKTGSARGVSMSVSLLPPPARIVALPIAVARGTARRRRKRRTQRRRDPRIRTRNRIRRNRGSVNAFRRLSMSVRWGRQRMTALLILMWRMSVELLWPRTVSISRCAHRSTDRRRRS
jgi:hypothetical protein